MKRRRFVQTLVAAPAIAAAQQPATSPQGTRGGPPGGGELPKLDVSVADAAAEPVPRFFDARQLAALRKLSDILQPPMGDSPGALDAGAPEFLDFLVGQSPADRQQVYRAGLDGLNSAARKRFNKWFGDVDATEAGALLAPLREPWTYSPPADPVARLLRAAKQDVRTATMNSREWAKAGDRGGRRQGGQGLYWYPLD
jgi:hypothetical protein